MAMMYIPPPNNGNQTSQAASILSQLMLLKISQKFREKEADIETEKAMAVKGWTKEAPPSGGGAATEGIKEPEGGPTPPEATRKLTLRGQTYYQGPLEIQQIPGTRYVRIGRGIDETFLESKGKQFSTPVTLQGKEGAVTGFLQVDDEGRLVLTGKMPGEQTEKTPNEIELQMRADAGDEVAARTLKNYRAAKLDAAIKGRSVFNVLPGQVPGLMYERMDSQGRPSGRAFIYDNKGNQIYLSSKEAQGIALKYKEEVPTETLKTMSQMAPSVANLAEEAKDSLAKVEVGPLVGRWKDLWTGKVGAEDKPFTELRTNVNFVRSLLQKMHLGSRGGQYFYEDMEKLFEAGKMSAGNLKTALDTTIKYANKLSQGIIPDELSAAIARWEKDQVGKKGGTTAAPGIRPPLSSFEVNK